MTREEVLAQHPIIICEVSAYTLEKTGEIIVNVRANPARLSGKSYVHPDNTRTAVNKLMKLTSVYNESVLARETVCLESDLDEAIKLIHEKLKSEADRLVAHYQKMQEIVKTAPQITYHGKKNGSWDF